MTCTHNHHAITHKAVDLAFPGAAIPAFYVVCGHVYQASRASFHWDDVNCLNCLKSKPKGSNGDGKAENHPL